MTLLLSYYIQYWSCGNFLEDAVTKYKASIYANLGFSDKGIVHVQTIPSLQGEGAYVSNSVN